ncbi:hypothetical protein G9A89_018165 [Geosiphon pyriformis]|nr:hypothetical protein G9A89_018165 [Geosiphon pyriformis]
MTYIGKFNKLFKQIRQLETNNYYSNAQILDQFIAGLKDKLIKKVCPHAPKDLNSAIQHAKRYKIAIEKTNHTKLKPAQQLRKKLTNSQKRLKTILPINNNSNPKDINHFKDEIKITLHHFLITSLKIAITVESLATGKEIAESYNETNKIGQFYYQPPLLAYYSPRLQYPTIPTTTHTTLSINNNRISLNNQLVPRNSTQPRPNHYHTQPSYLTMPEEQNFHHTAPLEGRATAQQQNPSHNHTTILPARIAKNANLSDIFPFEFEANKSPFLLSSAAANKQKAITAMYTEAEAERKPIRLILDSRSAGSIITYQLMQQLKRNTVIITADGMKKTPVGEINNFPFTLDRITIPVKVLIINAPQLGNPRTTNLLPRTTCLTPAFEFKPEEEKPIIETFMALGSTFNWANETEQKHFTPHSKLETPGWNIPYSKLKPKKQRLYISLKCKDCHKKLSLMGACISPEEEYENHTYYYCKACHRE